MKILNSFFVSTVVAGVLVSSSLGADNLSDAFTNGTVSGELKAFYFDRNEKIQIAGTYVIDYLRIFKLYTFGVRDSNKLDNVGYDILG